MTSMFSTFKLITTALNDYFLCLALRCTIIAPAKPSFDHFVHRKTLMQNIDNGVKDVK